MLIFLMLSLLACLLMLLAMHSCTPSPVLSSLPFLLTAPFCQHLALPCVWGRWSPSPRTPTTCTRCPVICMLARTALYHHTCTALPIHLYCHARITCTASYRTAPQVWEGPCPYTRIASQLQWDGAMLGLAGAAAVTGLLAAGVSYLTHRK